MFSCVVRIGSLAVSCPEVWARMYGFFTSIYIYIYIYNSVITLRHNIINSSASVPLNDKKIAVKKDSEVDLSMFGPEL